MYLSFKLYNQYDHPQHIVRSHCCIQSLSSYNRPNPFMYASLSLHREIFPPSFFPFKLAEKNMPNLSFNLTRNMYIVLYMMQFCIHQSTLNSKQKLFFFYAHYSNCHNFINGESKASGRKVQRLNCNQGCIRRGDRCDRFRT